MKLNLKTTLAIKKDIDNGLSMKEVSNKHNICSATYYRIKKCEGRYSFLKSKKEK